MISILIKASLIIVVVLAFYKLFLEKESFFAANRIFLITGLVIAFVLPFVMLPELVENQGVVSSWLPNTSSEVPINSFDEIGAIDLNGPENSETAGAKIESIDQNSHGQARSFAFWISLFYFFGFAILTINLISQLVKLGLKINKSKDIIIDRQFTIINTEVDSAPCSFFNYLFIDPSKYDPKTYEQIVAHEKIHAQKKHSIDLLVAEIAIVILWFNPIIWLYRKEVEKNCEYQTDAILLDTQTVEAENYQMSLLEIASERKPLTLVSNYNQSLIKKRILMMNKQKSNKYSYFKYAFIAPVLLATLLLLNQPFTLNAQQDSSVDFHNEKGYSEEYSHHGDHSDNLPPLHKAAADGSESAVKNILDSGANVNEIARGDGTALYLAIQHDHWEVATLLLEKGANPNIGSRASGYPILLAVMTKDPKLVQLLVKHGAKVDMDFPGDGNAMIQAAKNGDLNMVMELVDLKADINRGVKGDGNPLIMASKAGQLHVVKYLVGLGADVNYEVVGDEVPLIGASEQGHLAVVKFLAEKGADVNKVCKEVVDGRPRVRTALKMARKNGHDTVIKYLISKGAKK